MLRRLPMRAGAQLIAARRALISTRPVARTADVFFRVRAMAEAEPTRVAIVENEGTVSYGQLTGRVHQMGACLIAQGCEPGDCVAVVGPRSADTIAIFLSVEVIGAVYVPVDPTWPVSRLAEMFHRARPQCLIVHGSDQTPAAGAMLASAQAGVPVVAVPDHGAHVITEMVPRPVTAGEPRYVIHTSGSTGRPKGAIVTQAGLMNHLWSMVDILRLRRSDVVAFSAAPTYVISVWQMVAVLLAGGRVAIVDDEAAQFGRRLVTSLARAGVTVLELVPTVISWIVEEARRSAAATRLPDLRCVLSTGEMLRPSLARQFLRTFPSVEFYNAYGASECSDDVSLHRISSVADDVARMPAGVPLPNVALYLLVYEDGGWRAAEPHEPGELWVGGAGVGLGYLNEPRLGAERFFLDEFEPCSPTGRIYRTGDLAVFADGLMFCLGRADRQVKISGMRIELDEVEAAIGRIAGVTACAVLAERRRSRFDADDACLVVHVVADPGVSDADLLAAARTYLPPAVVPDRWVRLDEIPLNTSGKIDYEWLRMRRADEDC